MVFHTTAALQSRLSRGARHTLQRRQSLWKAVETLRILNQDGQSAIPKNPREFVPRRWRPHIFDGDRMDRADYELGVLSELSLAQV
jgi:hypothetical protein